MSAGSVGWVYECSPYRGARLLVHLALADSANDMHGFEVWARQGWIAAKARVSRSAVNDALAAMVADGLLELVEDNSRRGRPNRYRLLTPPLDKVWSPRGVSPQTTPGVATDDTGVSPQTTPGVATDDTEPNRNPTDNPTGSQSPPNPPGAELVLVSEELVPSTDPVTAIFEAWQQATGHSRSVLSRDRRRKIEAALKEFDLDTCVAAVRGITRSGFHMGQNENRTVYDDITVALKNAKNIERFAELDRTDQSARGDNRSLTINQRLAKNYEAANRATAHSARDETP